jgi:nicotinate-nucleotide pyrophosphorylase (carboxylating)
MRLEPEALSDVVRRALEEDLGSRGDVTTVAVVDADARARAVVLARRPLVVAGLPVAHEVCRAVDSSLRFTALVAEGAVVESNTPVARIEGCARSILQSERTLLNFLMRMCGIASAARAAVDEVAGTAARILDTRKTAPGLRRLDKYAVAAGGATNHRMGLYDAVMIKDTHLAGGLSVAEAVRRALAAGHAPENVTAEVRTLEQLDEAIAAGAGRALLDNMDLPTMRHAVRRADGRIVLEASGGMRPGHLRAVAETGVDCISVGWLTHSAPAADLAMETETLR